MFFHLPVSAAVARKVSLVKCKFSLCRNGAVDMIVNKKSLQLGALIYWLKYFIACIF